MYLYVLYIYIYICVYIYIYIYITWWCAPLTLSEEVPGGRVGRPWSPWATPTCNTSIYIYIYIYIYMYIYIYIYFFFDMSCFRAGGVHSLQTHTMRIPDTWSHWLVQVHGQASQSPHPSINFSHPPNPDPRWALEVDDYGWRRKHAYLDVKGMATLRRPAPPSLPPFLVLGKALSWLSSSQCGSSVLFAWPHDARPAIGTRAAHKLCPRSGMNPGSGREGPEVGSRAARALCHLISPSVHARKNTTYEPDVWAPALGEPIAQWEKRWTTREEGVLGAGHCGVFVCIYIYIYIYIHIHISYIHVYTILTSEI